MDTKIRTIGERRGRNKLWRPRYLRREGGRHGSPAGLLRTVGLRRRRTRQVGARGPAHGGGHARPDGDQLTQAASLLSLALAVRGLRLRGLVTSLGLLVVLGLLVSGSLVLGLALGKVCRLLWRRLIWGLVLGLRLRWGLWLGGLLRVVVECGTLLLG